MYGHEASLIANLKDKPFAILGVNSDKSREKCQTVIAREKQLTRSWWDGGSTRGPIASRWNVQGWPTIYVLDHEGVIRAKGPRGPALEKAIAELMPAAEKALARQNDEGDAQDF